METPKCIAHSMCGPTSSDLRDVIHSFTATEQERSCAFEDVILYKSRESVAPKHLQEEKKTEHNVVATPGQTLCYFFFCFFVFLIVQLSAEYRCDSQEHFFKTMK